MDHPEGARETGDGRLGFDRRVRLEFRGTQLSSDGVLLVMRELDDVLGLSDLARVRSMTVAVARIPVTGLTGFFGNQSVVGLRATRTSPTPTDWLLIPSCARLSVALPSMRRHPNCASPPSSASVMCVTAILIEAARKRQDRSVHRAEERLPRARMMRFCGSPCPHSNVLTHASAAQGPKRLISKRNLTISPSSGKPLGECRLRGGQYGYLVSMKDPVALIYRIDNALSNPISSEILAEAIKPFQDDAILAEHFRLLGL